MNFFKRFGCLALVLSLVLTLLFTGCSDNNEGNTDTNAAANKSEEKPKLQVYLLGKKGKDLDKVEAEMNKILENEIGATIKLNFFDWADYKDKQQLFLSSGKEMDVMFSPHWMGFASYVTKKAFLELDKLLDDYGQDIKKNIVPAYLEAPRINGKLYAIPTNKDITGLGGILLNKSLVDKYGFDIESIKTPRDLEPMFDVIKEKED